MTAIPAGFLQAILEDPAADTPRMILADWLDENGEPERAEFIRVQCELAALPEFRAFVRIKPGSTYISSVGAFIAERFEPVMCHNPPEAKEAIEFDDQNMPDPHREKRQKLQERERKLLDLSWQWHSLYGMLRPHDEAIGAAFGRGDGECQRLAEESPKYVFRRGFVSNITGHPSDWLIYCQTILAAHPIETVQLGTLTLAIWPEGGSWHLRLSGSGGLVDPFTGMTGSHEAFTVAEYPDRAAMVYNHPNWLTCVVEELRPHHEITVRPREVFMREMQRAYRAASLRTT